MQQILEDHRDYGMFSFVLYTEPKYTIATKMLFYHKISDFSTIKYLDIFIFCIQNYTILRLG